MANDPFAYAWPWLDYNTADDQSGFSAGTTPTAFNSFTPARGYDVALGLPPPNWRSLSTESTSGIPGTGLSPATWNPLAADGTASQPFWLNGQDQNGGLEGQSGPRWPWLSAESLVDTPGFRMQPDGSVQQSQPSNDIRMMEGAYERPDAGDAFARFSLSPGFAASAPQPWWSFQKSDDDSGSARFGSPGRSSFETSPFDMNSAGLRTSPQSGGDARPWWDLAQDQSTGFENQTDPQWPWLLAETATDVPGFRMQPDGSVDSAKPRMMAGAYDPPTSRAYPTFLQRVASSRRPRQMPPGTPSAPPAHLRPPSPCLRMARCRAQ